MWTKIFQPLKISPNLRTFFLCSFTLSGSYNSLMISSAKVSSRVWMAGLWPQPPAPQHQPAEGLWQGGEQGTAQSQDLQGILNELILSLSPLTLEEGLWDQQKLSFPRGLALLGVSDRRVRSGNLAFAAWRDRAYTQLRAQDTKLGHQNWKACNSVSSILCQIRWCPWPNKKGHKSVHWGYLSQLSLWQVEWVLSHTILGRSSELFPDQGRLWYPEASENLPQQGSTEGGSWNGSPHLMLQQGVHPLVALRSYSAPQNDSIPKQKSNCSLLHTRITSLRVILQKAASTEL
jgi:hypothetical protein